MTEKEAEHLAAELETTVEDKREDKRIPLPALPG
jgi:hypothetical protein